MKSGFFDPLKTLLDLQSALDASGLGGWLSGTTSGAGGYPPINVFEQGESFRAIAELPGLERETLAVEIHRNRLRIAGRRSVDAPEGASFHRRERPAGSFDRTIALPVTIDRERVNAHYHNGLLIVDLPRAEADKPKTIEVA